MSAGRGQRVRWDRQDGGNGWVRVMESGRGGSGGYGWLRASEVGRVGAGGGEWVG